MMKRIANLMYAGWTLGMRNIRVQMREHLLGYAWTLIIPIFYAFFYILVKRELAGELVSKGNDAAMGVFRAFAGITLFQCWMQILQDMTNMIRRQRGMLRGLDIPASPFVIAIMIEGGISLFIRSILIIVAIPILGLPFPLEPILWIWFAASIFALLLSSSAIGLVLAPWATLFGDVRKALQSISLPLILVSPIFYAATNNQSSLLYWLNIVNPLASPLAVLAEIHQSKTWPLYAIPMLVWIMLSAMLIFLALVQLRRQIPILLERMGS